MFERVSKWNFAMSLPCAVIALSMAACAADVESAHDSEPVSQTELGLGLHSTATASSVQNASLSAANAVDGNTGTRWSSASSDPQWLRVDLGAKQAVARVVLRWEAAYSKSYQIQQSDDGNVWSTVYSTTTGKGGVEDLTVTANARYLRLYSTQRATTYGVSLWEFEAYAPTAASTSVALPARIDGGATARWGAQVAGCGVRETNVFLGFDARGQRH